jgi:hypothetical protein
MLCMLNSVTGKAYTVIGSENRDWWNRVQLWVLATVTFRAVYEPRVVMKQYTTVDAGNRD